jgi:hypothetical protein
VNGARITILALLAADAAAFLWCRVPSWLGQVGSEAYEWQTLKWGIISGVLGAVLLAAAGIAFATRKDPKRA